MPWSLTSTAQLNRIEQKLDQLLTLSQQETSKMAIDLTALTAEVANNTSVDASIVQLVESFVQKKSLWRSVPETEPPPGEYSKADCPDVLPGSSVI